MGAADLKLVTVVGARPQFVKAAALRRAIAAHNEAKRTPQLTEVVIHTGQHYDPSLSETFFSDLELPPPSYHLGVGSASHAVQTAEMLRGLEPVLVTEDPDLVVVVGDTNSTLAGALAAAKLNRPVAHVEAGLRAGRRDMPEEVNRVVTDHVSEFLFCSSQGAVANLAREGIRDGVFLVGDVMHDVLLWQLGRPRTGELPSWLASLPPRYAIATVHRAENTDSPERLEAIVGALERVGRDVCAVVLPLHPRTKAAALGDRHAEGSNLIVGAPVGYSEMLHLLERAALVLTDSGGLQKEAYWLGVPCITLREETEWPETVAAGWNVTVGADEGRILAAAESASRPVDRPPLYGRGDAAERILRCLIDQAS